MKKGIIYNFLLLFLVMILFTEVYVVLSGRHNQILDPNPPLGTHAQEIFTAYGEGEILRVNFVRAVERSFCASFVELGAVVQPKMHSAIRYDDTAWTLAESYQNILASKVDARLQGHPSFPQGALGKLVVYPARTRTVVSSTKPVLVTRTAAQGTIEVPVRFTADIPSPLGLTNITDVLSRITRIDGKIHANATCRITVQHIKDCLASEQGAILKQHPSMLLETHYGQVSDPAKEVLYTTTVHVPAPQGCDHGFSVSYASRIVVAPAGS